MGSKSARSAWIGGRPRWLQRAVDRDATDSSKMMDTYNQGDFAEAAIAGDEMFEEVLRQQETGGSRWATCVRRTSSGSAWAKISGCGPLPRESRDVPVAGRPAGRRCLPRVAVAETLNVDSWDATQFTEDIGQAVVGADRRSTWSSPTGIPRAELCRDGGHVRRGWPVRPVRSAGNCSPTGRRTCSST